MSAEILTGTFANTVSDLDDDLYATVPDFDGGTHKWGPLHWDARSDGTMPHAGDPVVLLETDDGDAWVLAWGPAT